MMASSPGVGGPVLSGRDVGDMLPTRVECWVAGEAIVGSVLGLSCFGAPRRRSSRRPYSLMATPSRKQPAKQTISPAHRSQQEWRANNKQLARTSSYPPQRPRGATTTDSSRRASSASLPLLPLPCQGLFESSRTTNGPKSSTMGLPASTTGGQLLSLPFDIDSRNPEAQGLPVPLPLSPLLSPGPSQVEQQYENGNGSLTQILPCDISCSPSSTTFHTALSAAGQSGSPTFPSSVVLPNLNTLDYFTYNRSNSDSQSSSNPCASSLGHPSTCSNPRLSLDIECVINYAGQTLKETLPPKTWAVDPESTADSNRTTPRVFIRENSMEDVEHNRFGFGALRSPPPVGIDSVIGAEGLILPPLEQLETQCPSAAVIVGADGIDFDLKPENEDEVSLSEGEEEEEAEASSSDSRVYVDAGSTPRRHSTDCTLSASSAALTPLSRGEAEDSSSKVGSGRSGGGDLKSRRSFLSRVRRSFTGLRPRAQGQT